MNTPIYVTEPSVGRLPEALRPPSSRRLPRSSTTLRPSRRPENRRLHSTTAQGSRNCSGAGSSRRTWGPCRLSDTPVVAEPSSAFTDCRSFAANAPPLCAEIVVGKIARHAVLRCGFIQIEASVGGDGIRFGRRNRRRKFRRRGAGRGIRGRREDLRTTVPGVDAPDASV